MAEPAVADSSDDSDAPEPDAGESEEVVSDEEADVEMVQTDIETTGTDPDGFFDGVETDKDTGEEAADSIFDGVEGDDSGGGGGGGGDSAEAAETRSSGLAADINAGVARAAVIGLDDEWTTPNGEEKKKSELEDEFRETFEAFRLGHYASICAEEYLLMEAEDIHPVWGLLGASLICAAVIVYKRPDGDQVVETAKLKLGQTDLSSLTDSIPTGED